MKNTANILFALLIVVLASCDFSYSKSWSKTTISERDNAVIELEIEKKGYFTNEASGEGDGEFFFQRIGSLKKVVESIIGDKGLMIEGMSDEFIYDLKVTNYPSAEISEIASEILDLMADEGDFNWTTKEGTEEFYAFEISDKALLLEARDHQPGVKQLTKIQGNRANFVGSLSEFVSFLNENIVDRPIKGDVPELDFNLKFELPIGDEEKMIAKLEKSYGISLTEKTGPKETIFISAK